MKGEKNQHIESSISLRPICVRLRAIVIDSSIDRESGERVKFAIFTYISVTFWKRRREALMYAMLHLEPSLNSKISTTNNMCVISQSLITTLPFISHVLLASTKTLIRLSTTRINKNGEKRHP